MGRKERQWLDYVRSNRVALQENRAAPDMLHELAGAYFGDFVIGDNKAGIEGLKECLSERYGTGRCCADGSSDGHQSSGHAGL